MLLIEAERADESGDQSRRQANDFVIVVNTYESGSREAIAFPRLFAELELMSRVVGFDLNCHRRLREPVGIQIGRIAEGNGSEPGLSNVRVWTSRLISVCRAGQ